MEKDIRSIFDLEVGDCVRHGCNYGTVTRQTERGPEIQWKHGQIDYWYTQDMHKIHPLHLAEPDDPPAILDSWPPRDELGRLTDA